MKKWIISITILSGLAAFLYFSGKKPAHLTEKQHANVPSETQPPPEVASGQSGDRTSAPSQPGFAPAPSRPSINVENSPLDMTKQKQIGDKAELERMKALNKTHVAQVEKMMKTNEITSLRQSIAEDEQTLKKIEASGTDIEGYKFVEKNLQARKARLKKLLQ